MFEPASDATTQLQTAAAMLECGTGASVTERRWKLGYLCEIFKLKKKNTTPSCDWMKPTEMAIF